jgi:hypothetical protein
VRRHLVSPLTPCKGEPGCIPDATQRRVGPGERPAMDGRAGSISHGWRDAPSEIPRTLLCPTECSNAASATWMSTMLKPHFLKATAIAAVVAFAAPL